MQHVDNSNQTRLKSADTDRQPARASGCIILLIVSLLGLAILLVVFNFASFRLAQSQTETDISLGTSRSGTTMPINMRPGFSLNYAVARADKDALATAVSNALSTTLTDDTLVGRATAVADVNASAVARLYVQLDTAERLWTPVYGRADVTATVYVASHVDVPWPKDEVMIHNHSPEIQAIGEFTVVDTSWGLLTKQAYTNMIADALAQAISEGLQQDIWQRP